MQLSAINRVRYTAWAWLAAAFMVGGAVGGAVAGLTLLQQLRETKLALEQQQLRQELGAWSGVAPRPGEEALAVSSDVRVQLQPALPLPTAQPVQQEEPAASTALQPVETPSRSVASVKVAPPPPPPPAVRSAAPAPIVKAKVQSPPPAAAAAKPSPTVQKDEAEAQKVASARAQEALRAKALKAVQAPAADGVNPVVPAAQPKATAPVERDNNAPTQRVTKDEAGLSEVEPGGVTFKSGRRVAVGDSFPSGERLVSVDPSIGEIITTKRRIVLKAPGATQQ